MSGESFAESEEKSRGGTLTVECPSGLVVELRKFKVRDEDLLGNKKAIKKGTGVTQLLGAVTLNVDEVGPYSMSDPDRKHPDPWFDWGQVLQGDRQATLLKNRIRTWGHEHTFRRPCENARCREPVTLDVDFREFPIKPLPETSQKHASDPNGNPLFVRLPECGVKVGFRLLRGVDELQLQKIAKAKKDSLSSSYLRLRTVSVEGVKQPDWKRWLADLDGGDASYLRAAFDEHDCGVDQEVEFGCDDCFHVFRDDVQFSSDFLFPKYRGEIAKKV